MKQVTLTAPKTFEIHEVETPSIQPHEALLKVKAVGICGSDIHAYFGKHPFMSFPITLGHEAAGVVEAVGLEQDLWSESDWNTRQIRQLALGCTEADMEDPWFSFLGSAYAYYGY